MKLQLLPEGEGVEVRQVYCRDGLTIRGVWRRTVFAGVHMAADLRAPNGVLLRVIETFYTPVEWATVANCMSADPSSETFADLHRVIVGRSAQIKPKRAAARS